MAQGRLKSLGTIKAFIKNTWGNEYVRVGTLFEDTESGGYAMKLDAVPLNHNWQGWMNVFPNDKTPAPGEPPVGGPAKEPKPAPSGKFDDLDDDIPF
jgi:hypothetical protein